MNTPVKVAVFGSCVTRDVFNRRFVPDYQDLFDCVALSNQVSLMSIVDDPLAVPDDALQEIDERARRDVRDELGRVFLAQLATLQPDYLIIDLFADVHFGAATIDPGVVVTRNRWKTVKTDFYTTRRRSELAPDSPQYFARWALAADRFFELVAAATPRTKVVLHEARNVTRWRTADGGLETFGNAAALEAMNTRWRAMDAYLKERHADHSISIFTPDRVSSQTHPWGPFAVHYELDYHTTFAFKLARIALMDAGPASGAERVPRQPAPTSRFRLLRR